MISILLGALVVFIFGFLWYGHVFSMQWIKLMKFSPEQIAESKKGSMAQKAVVMAVLNIVTASVVYFLLPQLLSLSYSEFMKSILMIWFGFAFPLQMGGYLWEGKSLKLVAFNTVANVISFSLLSAVIYYF